jgi:hypothetical protein
LSPAVVAEAEDFSSTWNPSKRKTIFATEALKALRAFSSKSRGGLEKYF